MEIGLIMFIAASIGLIATMIWPFLPLPQIPQRTNVMLLLATVAIAAGFTLAYDLPSWVALITFAGAVSWMMIPIFGLPQVLYKLAMMLTVAGATWTLILILL